MADEQTGTIGRQSATETKEGKSEADRRPGTPVSGDAGNAGKGGKKATEKSRDDNTKEADRRADTTVSEIENLLSGYTQEMNVKEEPDNNDGIDIEIPLKKKTRRSKKAVVSGEIMTGAMFLFLIDTIFPSVICAVNNRFSDKKVSPEKLMLTANQKKELEPLAQQVAEHLQAKGDPVTMFAITLLSLYGLNLMMQRAGQ